MRTVIKTSRVNPRTIRFAWTAFEDEDHPIIVDGEDSPKNDTDDLVTAVAKISRTNPSIIDFVWTATMAMPIVIAMMMVTTTTVMTVSKN